MTALGYADERYVESLADHGRVRRLRHCRGSLLLRPLPTGDGVDATGAYPLFDCTDWSGLATDVEELRDEAVSLVLVSDPFAEHAHESLLDARPDAVWSYKDHYVVDLARPLSQVGRPSRRRTALRALDELDVAAIPGSLADVDSWVALYENVIRRHAVTGLAAFSPAGLAAQLALPGAELLTARRDGEVVAAQVCLRRGDVVYSHLAASTDVGYALRAMHGLDLFAIEHFSRSARWFDLGGGRGGEDDGLAAYKASWATTTRPTWLVGWVLDEDRYERLSRDRPHTDAPYFPAYRAGVV